VSDHEHSSDEHFDTYFDPAVLLGQWTDRTLVHRAHAMFAIDFVRDVPIPAQRVLVARALVMPALAADLRDQLDEAWRAYLETSMPEDRR
jgi:hypothetical protein